MIWYIIVIISVDCFIGLDSLNTFHYKEVIQGQTAKLDCNIGVDSENEWHHIAVDSTDINYLMKGKMHYVDSVRCSIGASGNYDLVIANVKMKDAGEYICKDKDRRTIIQFSLTVLDPLLECSSSVHSKVLVAENSCGIAPDIVTLSCSVGYSGVVAPVLKWVNINGKDHSQNTQEGNHKVVNTVQANVTWNNFMYECLLEMTGKSCHTVITKPTYVFNTHEERLITWPQTVICSANSSQACSYKWIHDGKEVSSEHQLELFPGSPSGEYQCLAECWLHDMYCSIRPYVLTYDFQLNNNDRSDWLIYSNIITAIVVIFLLGVVFLVKYRNPRGYTIQRNMTRWRKFWRFVKWMMSIGMCSNEAIQPLVFIDIPGRVKGIAQLGPFIFISTFEKKSIDGFSTKTFEHKMEIPVRGLKEARGMAACKHKNVIYITDRVGRDVIRISIPGRQTFRWNTGSDPEGVSVIKETQDVAVACPFENAVKVFKFDGKKVRNVNLPGINLGHLYHGWQMINLNYLVCYGPESDDPGEHQHMRICIVEPGNTESDPYINKAIYPGADKHDLIWPMRVAETKRGGVLVISSVDKKVLLFDSNLQQFDVLIHTSDNFLLNRMCLDEDTHRLFISELSKDLLSSRILVYELTDDELNASLDVPNSSSNDPLLPNSKK